MTQKDYITKAKPKANQRGKSTTSKARPKKTSKTTSKKASKPAANNNQPKPFIAIALAVVALSSFGYFLYSINGAAEQPLGSTTVAEKTKPQQPAPQKNQAPPPKEPKKTETQIVASKPATKQTAEIPTPPEGENWEYMRELKQKDVKVDVKKIESEGPYLMQCGTFRDPRRAETLKAQLALLGFESRIKVTKSDKGGYHHRVQLGPFELNRDAQAARHKLTKHNINGCKIWLWT